ncbi:hypothetical protein [Terrabacter sp. C0L_2]|uniref:hypothetical protein n=1 Tax=Terrabacter sp. C0L_2 TaxID=3108389 RepID=UPI002ED1391F|nr:hypothetical protein U5C87_17840 [Terrabacter sp. C0L_2]
MAVVHLSTASRNAAVSAIAGLVDADAGPGKVLIYDGTIPADAGTAVTTQVLLATVILGDPAYAAPSAGTVTGADPASVNAVASGTAAWFRQTDNSGDVVMDGDVTATGGGGTMTLSTVSLTTGSPVDITSLSITMPSGA